MFSLLRVQALFFYFFFIFTVVWALQAPKETSFQSFLNSQIFKARQVESLVVNQYASVSIHLKPSCPLFQEFKVVRTKKGLVKVPLLPRPGSPNGQLRFSIGSLEVFETQLYEAQKGRRDSLSPESNQLIPVYYKEVEAEHRTGLLTYASYGYLLYLVLAYAVRYATETKSPAGIKGVTNIDKKFSDVIGNDDAKLELKEFVDILKNPARYKNEGVKWPKGALLTGPPGTGKTLLAKAVAGEVGNQIPFFAFSGADFSDKWVGTGNKKVREIFHNASKYPAAIIFIDEIDVLARKRGGDDSFASREADTTLNQLLVCMDGVEKQEGITIVLGATNLVDAIDPALLRPGRLDRRIYVGPASLSGRIDQFKYYLRPPKKLAPGVDIQDWASQLADYAPVVTGAEIENICNEGALLAIRNNHPTVQLHDLFEAVDKVLLGFENKSATFTPKEERRLAYRAISYAAVNAQCTVARRLPKISIYQRSSSEKESMARIRTKSKQLLHEEMLLLLTGAAAEELFNVGGSNWPTPANWLDDAKKAKTYAQVYVESFGFDASPKVSELVAGNTVTTDVKTLLEKEMEIVKKFLGSNRGLIIATVPSLIQDRSIPASILYCAGQLDELIP